MRALDGGKAAAPSSGTFDPREQGIAALRLFGDRVRTVYQLTAVAAEAYSLAHPDERPAVPGSFQGLRFNPTEEQLTEHFAGGAALGFTGSVGRRTGHWFGGDVDARWPERWPIIAEVLRRYGYHKAAVFTDGTRPTKSGKWLVFVKNALPLGALRSLAKEIDDEARADARFGPIANAKENELYPKAKGVKGEGGVVRLGGRHATKGVRCDRVFAFDGQDLDLRTVEPLPINAVPAALRDPQPYTIKNPHRFVRRWRTEGLDPDILARGHHAINRAIMRCGHEAFRVHGDPAGREVLRRWLADITKATPILASGEWTSPKTSDKRNPLDWESSGAGAWHQVLHEQSGRNATLVPSAFGGLVWHSSAADPVLSAIEEYVRTHGLHPDGFELSYRQIAARIGAGDPKAVWRKVQALVKAGKLKIVHRGTQSSTKGLKTIFGLAQSWKTPAAGARWAEKTLARRETRMQEYARRKWAEANDPSLPPVERRQKRRALARETVHVGPSAASDEAERATIIPPPPLVSDPPNQLTLGMEAGVRVAPYHDYHDERRSRRPRART